MSASSHGEISIVTVQRRVAGYPGWRDTELRELELGTPYALPPAMFLTSSQFLLLNALVRRDVSAPQAIPAPTEYAARALADKGMVSIVPMDDLGMLWVRVTDAGRQHGQRMPTTYVEQIAVAS